MLINIDYHIFDQIEVPDNASSAEIREAIDKMRVSLMTM